jgi:hypothetical protein
MTWKQLQKSALAVLEFQVRICVHLRQNKAACGAGKIALNYCMCMFFLTVCVVGIMYE